MSATLEDELRKWGSETASKVGVSVGKASAEDTEMEIEDPGRLRDLKSGFVWHDVAEPAASKAGARMEAGADGRITSVRIAGRPAGKHGGTQGQHTTAFAANREVVVAATVGRSENEARKTFAELFRVLLTYPAFSDASRPVDPKLKAKIVKLAEPNTSYSLEQLAVLYLEVRDALPGASLDTGINGKASGASRKNITGKGEGTTLEMLRRLEEAYLTKQKPDAKIEGAAVDLMASLYDATSEDAAGLELADRFRQRKTFLLTIAQAFPAVFQLWGAKLADRLNKGLADDDQNDMLASTRTAQKDICQTLIDGNATGSRPATSPFVASLGETGAIEFVGRPKSVKDGGTMGDHTTCEALMKKAATRLFMPTGEAPTMGALADAITLVRAEFAKESFSFFDDKTVPMDGSSDFATVPLRLSAMAQADADLQRLGDIAAAANRDEVAETSLVLEAAETYMALVDNRPTATISKAPSRGRNEAGTLAKLDAYEGGAKLDPPTLLATAMGLFDSQAAMHARMLLQDHNKDAGEAYLTQVAHEFVFFLQRGYPKVFAALGGDVTKLEAAIRDRIIDEGSSERGDGEATAEDFGGDAGKMETEVIPPSTREPRKNRKAPKRYGDDDADDRKPAVKKKSPGEDSEGETEGGKDGDAKKRKPNPLDPTGGT